jgi:phospholipase C
MRRSLLKATTAWVMAAALLNPTIMVSVASAATSGPVTGPFNEPALTPAGTSTSVGAITAPTAIADQGSLTVAQKVALLKQKVKYVFVLFQENRSFDHYFGTYPGGNGLTATYSGANPSDPYAQPANAAINAAGYNSVLANTDGTYSTLHPFLIPHTIMNNTNQTVQLYPEDTFSVDHSHAGYMNDFHFADANKTIPQNDGFPLNQEGLHYASPASCTPGSDSHCTTSATILNSSNVTPTANPTLATKQKGEVVISHLDCDTVPFLWQLADRFTLFDNFHQTMTAPSTPNAIAMIAGQTGDTQWAKHGPNGQGTAQAGQANTVPNVTDSAPFTGSTADHSPVQPPYGPDEATNSSQSTPPFAPYTSFPPQANLTFASLPLSFSGNQIGTIIRGDQDQAADLEDVTHDIATVAAKDPAVGWGWYQQGYGPEPFDSFPAGSSPMVPISTNILPSGYPQGSPEHASYIVHHNGPQYFGYVGDNTTLQAHLHSLQQFYTDLGNKALPSAGGVFYVRGGYYNNDKMLPADPATTVMENTPGNDDHPNYSDAGISEASIADSVNAIANSPYWSQSAIIITYDETDGLYDHVPEQFRTYGPDTTAYPFPSGPTSKNPETGGSRIPAIVISPYASSHVISHVYSEHSSVIQLIDLVFGLVPLADLPDEAAARTNGAANASLNAPNGSAQTNLGPADDPAVLTNWAPGMGSLLEAFDNDRLQGTKPVLPASYAMITSTSQGAPITLTPVSGKTVIQSLPHYAGTANSGGTTTYGCQWLQITPTDYPGGYVTGGETDPPPADFNPRPTQSPGSPFFNTNSGTSLGASTGPWPG